LLGLAPAGADMITPTTLPYEDKGVAVWYFLGDKVVGLNAERKGGKYVGHLDAYSLNDTKFLWHLDTPLGNKNSDVYPTGHANYYQDRWAIGTGPLSLIDLNAGTVQWAIPGKAVEFQGLEDKKKVRRLKTGFVFPAGADKDSSDVSPILLAIAGERFQGVSVADGKTLWQTKDKPGILCGVTGRLALFGKGKKLTAFNAETGAQAWQYDFKKGNTRIFTAADLRERKQTVPDGMDDIMIVGKKFLARVAWETGKEVWKIKRGSVRWRGSTYAAVAVGGGKVTGYDWNTGAKLWETKAGSKLVSHDAGDYVVLIDAKKKKKDDYLPPYKVIVVDGKTGKIVWTMKDIIKKPIVNYSFPVPGQIRLVSKKGVVANLNLSDGRPGLPPPMIRDQRFVEYSYGEKRLFCRDFAGNVVWTRDEEISKRATYTLGPGFVIWPTKKGTVELIQLRDGMLRWKSFFDQESPRAYMDETGHYLAVQGKKDISIVKLIY